MGLWRRGKRFFASLRMTLGKTVTLSVAKGLQRREERFFASLRMTCGGVAVSPPVQPTDDRPASDIDVVVEFHAPATFYQYVIRYTQVHEVESAPQDE